MAPGSCFRTRDNLGWLYWENLRRASDGVFLHGVPRGTKAPVAAPEAELDDALFQASEPACLLDSRGIVLDANPAMEDHFGHPPHRLIEQPFLRLLLPGFRKPAAAAFRDVLRHGRGRLEQARLNSGNGPPAWVEAVGQAVAGGPGRLIQVGLRDLSPGKEAARAWRRRAEADSLLARTARRLLGLDSEQLAEGILPSLADLGQLAGADRAVLFLFSSDQGRVHRSYEWTREGVESIRQITSGMSLDPFREGMNRLRRGEVFHVPRVAELPPEFAAEGRLLRELGVRSQLVVPVGLEGTLRGSLSFATTRRERHWTPEAIRPLREAGEILGRALCRRQRDLEGRSRQRASEQAHRSRETIEVATTLADRLNQPLAAAASYAQGCQLALESSGHDDLKEIGERLAQVSDQVLKAGAIINGLRRSLNGKGPRFRSVSLPELIREFFTSRELPLEKFVDQLDLRISPHLPALPCDPDQVRDLIRILVDNAVEAMEDLPEGARRLCLETVPQDDEVEVRVGDSGPGLPEPLREELFQPFFTTKEGRMGLGLSVARTIIEAHRGRIWASVPRDGGTCMHFTLPGGDAGKAALSPPLPPGNTPG